MTIFEALDIIIFALKVNKFSLISISIIHLYSQTQLVIFLQKFSISKFSNAKSLLWPYHSLSSPLPLLYVQNLFSHLTVSPSLHMTSYYHIMLHFSNFICHLTSPESHNHFANPHH